MSDYVRVQNDTGRAIKDTLTTDGSDDDLSGATVAFTMWTAGSKDSPVVDEDTANVSVTDAANGEVEYDFQSDDLADAVTHYFEWEVTYGDGTVITYRRTDGGPKTIDVRPEGA